MTTKITKAPEAVLSGKVGLDTGEPDLIRAIQFVWEIDDNDVLAWGLMMLLRWARADERVVEVLAARDLSLEEHGPNVAGIFERIRAAVESDAA